MTAALRGAAALGAALILVLASGFVERPTGEQAVYSNECRTEAGGPCLEPREGAGFPVAWVYDRPGVSVEHSVHPFEDEIRPGAFALNVGLVWAALWSGWALVVRREALAVRRRDIVRGGATALVLQAAAAGLYQTTISGAASWLGWIVIPLYLPALGLAGVADAASPSGLSTGGAFGALAVAQIVLAGAVGAGWALWRGRLSRGAR